MDLHQLIQDTDFSDPDNLKTAFAKLALHVTVQDMRLSKLEKGHVSLINEVTDLKNRVSKAERYSSKTCLTFYNMKLIQCTPEQAIVKLLTEFMRIPITLADIAACHFLPSSGPVKPIIVKFIYHHHRDMVWNRRHLMYNFCTYPNIFKWPVIIKERLPETDREIEKEAISKGLKVTTKNCQVFILNENGNIPVNNLDELDHFAAAPPKDQPPSRHEAVNDVVEITTPVRPKTTSKLPGKRLYQDIKTPIEDIAEKLTSLNDNVTSLVDSFVKITTPVGKVLKPDELLAASFATNSSLE